MGNSDDDLDIREELENNEFADNEYNGDWGIEHDLYDNGSTQPLLNLIDSKAREKAYEMESQLKKKGVNLNYDKGDTLITGLVLTGLTYTIHAVMLSLWLTVAYKIYRDSKINGEEHQNIWEKLDAFGFELFYFLVGSVIAAYTFDVMLDYTILLSEAGTLATITLEVMHFAGLG